MSKTVNSNDQLFELLHQYIEATKSLGTKEDQEDYRRVAAIARRVLNVAATEDKEQLAKEKFAFARQATDCYAVQPKEFVRLAKAIEDIPV